MANSLTKSDGKKTKADQAKANSAPTPPAQNKNDLPARWKWVKLDDLCDKISLNNIKIKQKDYLSEGKYPVIDQGQELVGGYYNDDTLVIPSEPPFIVFGDHTKVKKYITFKFIAGADGVKVLKPKDNVDPKFLFYSLFTIKIADKGYARHFQLLEKELFPLPNISEQRLIVSKIEELLSELDKGKQQLETAQQQLKVYRQAVLKSTFDSIIDKKTLVVVECCTHVVDCLHSTAKFTGSGYYCVDTTCIENGKILFDRIRFVDSNTYIKRISRLKPEKGDILFAREGTVGTTVIVPPNIDLCLGQRMMMFRLKKEIDSKYFMYYFQSSLFKSQYHPLIMGTTAPHLNIRDIRKFKVVVCSLEEQYQIVQEIESRLSVCDKVEETITASLQQAETLRQSILKKAYEGKLI